MREEKNGLRVGQRVKHVYIVLNNEKKRETRVHKGIVTDLYEHIFRVKWDDHNWLECFPYWMLESTQRERIVPM